MKRKEVLNSIQEKFKQDIIDILQKSDKRVYIEVKPESITGITQFVFKELGARFNTASGVDMRYNMEILYHFTFEDIDLVVSFRVKLSKDKELKINSLAPIFEGANWIEREIHEMLGIEFKGHPDMRRLLLSDDWPQDVHPLKTDYKEWDEKAIRDRGA